MQDDLERREACFGNVAERVYFRGFGDEKLFLPNLLLKGVRDLVLFLLEGTKRTGKKSESVSPAQLFATPWDVASQASLSMEFSRPEYWSGLPFPPPGDLPHPGTEPRSPALQADSLLCEPPGSPKRTEL